MAQGVCVLNRLLSFLTISSLITLSSQQGGNIIAFGNNQVSGNNNCKYITSLGANGQCLVTTQDIETKIKTIQADTARARLQYVAQNSVIQTQISQLEDTDKRLTLRVDGLQRDLLSIRSIVQRGGSGTVNNQNLIQVRDMLLQNIRNVDTRVSQLANQYSSQTTGLQQQVTKLDQDNRQLKLDNSQLKQDFASLKQDMQALTTQVRALASACSNCQGPQATQTTPTTVPTTLAPVTVSQGPTIAPSRITKLEQTVLNLTQALLQANQQIADLTADQLATNNTLQNHTFSFNKVGLELRSLDNRITALDTQQTQTYGAVTNLASQMRRVLGDVSTLKRDSAQLQTTVQALGTNQAGLAGRVATAQVERLTLTTKVNTLTSQQATCQAQLTSLNQQVQALVGGSTAAAPSTTGTTLKVPPLLNKSTTTIKAPPLLGGSTTKSSFPVPPTLKPVGPG